jgi:Putative zinc-finger
MNCRRVDERLSHHLEGLLSPREARAVDAHLDGCPACRRREEQLRALGPDLLALTALRTPPDLFHRALERWSEQTTGRAIAREALWLPPSGTRHAGGSWMNRRASIALAGIGLAAAVGIAALLLRPVNAPRPGGTHVAAFPMPDPAHRDPRSAALFASPRSGSRRPSSASSSGVKESTRTRLRPGRSTPLRLAGDPGGATVPPAIGRAPSPHSRPRPASIAQDDLALLNASLGQAGAAGALLPPQAWQAIVERARPRATAGDDFVQVPLPRLASTSARQIAQAAEQYQREIAVVDSRLAREVTVQQKATALSDLCERLRADTGIQLAAGQSVADEKVTLFCRKLPLRDVMRQLSRPFGYTWLRSGRTGDYRYELVQDLRSQLLEEELRNRGRNAALLALDREIERYRTYLDLSPDEALARARTAAPADKQLLENLAGYESGAIRMYYRLSPAQLAAFRAGQKLTFSQEPKPGEQPLPPDVARAVLQSLRDWRVTREENGFSLETDPKNASEGLPPAAVPEARATVILWLDHSELGQFTLAGGSGLPDHGGKAITRDGLAVGTSPTVRDPKNAAAHAHLAGDPALRARVTVLPLSSCGGDLSPSPSPKRGGVPVSGYGMPRPEGPSSPRGDGVGDKLPLPASGRGSGGEVNPPKVTTADVLEALHRATGLPIVADYYTRLYAPGAVSVRDAALFDALSRLADAMQMRWDKASEGGWLQFRSAGYYDDRVKEVPNRLLARWAASRRQHGALTLEDLAEIAQLSDAQLDSGTTMEGARQCFGLAEWDLAHYEMQRPHLRYLASFTPAQRQAMQSRSGLPFARMSLAQQQQFIALGLGSQDERAPSLAELREASLRVDYTQPGGFELSPLRTSGRASIPRATLLDRDGSPPPPVRERTREAALQAARRLDAQVDAAQIVPTELGLSMLYTWGDARSGYTTFVVRATPDETATWTLHSPRDRAGEPVHALP